MGVMGLIYHACSCDSYEYLVEKYPTVSYNFARCPSRFDPACAIVVLPGTYLIPGTYYY